MTDFDKQLTDAGLNPYLCYCLVSRQLARQVSRVYDNRLDAAGITASELAILEFVTRSGTMSVVDLAAVMVMERTTLLRTLKPLIEAGFVETARDPDNLRRHVVAITEKGEQKRINAHKYWLEAQSEFEQETGTDNARQLRANVLKMLGVL